MSAHSTAYHLLEGLLELGVEHVFANLGTDHASLIEALAMREAQGLPSPQFMLCPHENVAVHMAAGFAAVTGRGQAVLVHVDVGSANAALGLHNMMRRRSPVLILAGRAPLTLHGELPGSRDHFVHYMQDPFDIASLVRPFVKWEYDLGTGVNVKEVLARMHAVAHSAPAGPAYLTLPREVLVQDWPAQAVASFASPAYGPVPAGGCDPSVAAAIAQRIAQAQRPWVVTSYLGRNEGAVAELEGLALEAGLAVHEHNPSDLNLRRDSPCHVGFDAAASIGEADLVLLLDVDVPWLGHGRLDPRRSFVVQVDVDPIKQDMPMWGFPAHLRVAGDCATVLAQVRAALAGSAPAGFAARAASRMQALRAQAAARADGWRKQAREAGREGAVEAHYLCACLQQALGEEDIVVNEAVGHAGAVLAQLVRTKPGTYIGPAGGGLGYSGGMALGARLATPDRRVVQIVGDGSFHLGTPTSVYAVSQQYALPIFTVIVDNGGWAAVKKATRMVHPDGAAVARDAYQSVLRGPVRRFEDVGRAFGAHGESVDDPLRLPEAIRRCLEAVDDGRSAVLRVSVPPL